MPQLSIVTYPQKILMRKAATTPLNPEIKKLIPQMIETMYKNEGIGLAAPQVGISKRIIVVETAKEPREIVRKNKNTDKQSNTAIPSRGKPFVFLNPAITKKMGKSIIAEEGCLSLPGIFIPIKRVEEIELTCQTPQNENIHIKASGLTARIFQHEIDHLNGKLIIDHLSLFKRLKLRKQIRDSKHKG